MSVESRHLLARTFSCGVSWWVGMLTEGGRDADWRVIELSAKLGTVLTGDGKALDGAIVDVGGIGP